MGRLYVAYPHQGAMLRPDNRDKHAERHYSHVFFVSINLSVGSDSRGGAGHGTMMPLNEQEEERTKKQRRHYYFKFLL